MSFDSGATVLAGIYPNDIKRLTHAVTHLTPEHFPDKTQRSLFALTSTYFEKNGGVLPPNVLRHLLTRSSMDTGEQVLYAQVYKKAKETEVPDHEYRFAVQSLRDDVEHEKTGQAIATAFEILERGVEVGKTYREGHEAAWEYLYMQGAEISRASGHEMPEGDMRQDKADALEEYYKAKSGEEQIGIPTGLRTVDLSCGGIVGGDLALVAAFSGQGKSQLTCQMAWRAAVMHGQNVVYVTSETVRKTIRRRIATRHSRLPMFGLPEGLDSNAVKKGDLDAEQEKVYHGVWDDLDANPAYGSINVIQIPRGTTLGQVESLLLRSNQEAQVDYVVIDYLNLLRAERHRESARDEASDILREAKTMATAFDNGRSVPIVSPWQITQEAFKKAVEMGHYMPTSLAETAEAIRSPDLIVTLLRMPDTPKKAKMQVLKARDGVEVPVPFDLDVDYRNAFLLEPESMAYGFDAATVMGEDFGLG